jgi:putative ABC transport system permease protein
VNFNILKMSLQALQENKTKSALTVLGVVVGTAIVIIVLSVGAGVRGLILTQLGGITAESVWVEVQVPSKGTQGEKDSRSGQARVRGVQITTMTTDDMEDLVKLRNIENGFAIAIGQEKFTYKSEEKRTMFWGVSDQYPIMEDIEITEGSFFTAAENESLSQVAVLGPDIAETLFGNQSPIDKKIRVKGQNYKVIGITEKVGTQYFMNMDEMVFIPIQTAQKLILGQNHIDAISLKMEDKNLLVPTIKQIERKMRKNHGIKDPNKDDFVVRTMDEAMEIIDTVTDAISLLLFSIGCISLIVGGVGIMNVMYVSVIERTQEIGLKKAIGAKPMDIRMQFLIESICICLIGGIIGIALGIGISYGVSFLARYLDFDWPFILPASGVALAFCISAGIGILFGYAPAKKASQLNPIDALKS